jgi:hypothetical protein
MANIFIGGSRAVSKLNPAIREQLANLVNHNCTILIGDANGSDKAVQSYFAERGYRNVLVFCMHECRNNVGAWPVRGVTSKSSQQNFEYYSTKDRAMAENANCGLMLWDGKGKGTLANMFRLLTATKKVLVYFSPEKTFHKLSTVEDLRVLLQHCDKRDLDRATRELGLTPTLEIRQIAMPSS